MIYLFVPIIPFQNILCDLKCNYMNICNKYWIITQTNEGRIHDEFAFRWSLSTLAVFEKGAPHRLLEAAEAFGTDVSSAAGL